MKIGNWNNTSAGGGGQEGNRSRLPFSLFFSLSIKMSFLNKIIDKAKNHKNEESSSSNCNQKAALPKIPENHVTEADISRPIITGELHCVCVCVCGCKVVVYYSTILCSYL